MINSIFYKKETILFIKNQIFFYNFVCVIYGVNTSYSISLLI